MERLTDIINGWTFEETIKTAESLMEAEKNMFKWDVLRHLRNFAENYREQIKEYQQLEEQGRLLKPPCKIGDDVYFVPSEVNYKLNILNKHSNSSRDNEPCCRCDSRMTNADRIRNMSDEELADSLTATAKCDECFDIKEHESYCLSTSACRQKHLEWLQSEAE